MRALLLFLLLLGLSALALQRGWLVLPDAWNPWRPLDVREAPNALTPIKRWRLQQDRSLCQAALASSALRQVPVADQSIGACPLENLVRIQASPAGLAGSVLVSCPLAVAYAMFERHELQPLAQAVFGQRLVRVEHFGSFACRNIAGSSRRSQHASANALDLAAFVLADGRRISVAGHWSAEDARGRFLHQVRDAACRHFNVVLGPDYNAAHHDHFHVDMGGARVCR